MTTMPPAPFDEVDCKDTAQNILPQDELNAVESNEVLPSGDDPTAPELKLKRDLEARHITMIAIGGAVGVGLIIGDFYCLAYVLTNAPKALAKPLQEVDPSLFC